ncbi:MAG: cytochrome P450 [Anaerolineales bacterium]|nr:cytochrome P450 [Anaerolineales bacterium]
MTVAAPVVDIPLVNLSAPEVRADPYLLYARLRESAPLAQAKVPMFGRVWLISRYADVVAALKDPRFSSDQRNATAGEGTPRWLPRIFRILATSMVVTDDPDHYRLRNLVHQAFTPKRVEGIAARVEAITAELLDRAAAKRQVDLLADFALPLPLTVISEMMGVPARDRLNFHRWTAKFLETPSAGLGAMLAQLPNGVRLLRFFENVIAERRANPQDDLVSALVAAEEAGDRLNEEELLSMIFLLLLAGHETTVNLIANGTLALLQHPDQLERLRADPGLMARAVEELLRFTNPVEHGTTRHLLEDVTLHGVTLPKGSRALALLSSANRDETVFDNAGRLDLGRHPNRHVAFGLGIHYCLGAPLARLEGQIAFQALIERFPNMQLTIPPERVRWRSALAVRGLKALPVSLG